MLVCNIAENRREPGEKAEFCFGRNVLYTNRVEGITNSLHPTKKREVMACLPTGRGNSLVWQSDLLKVEKPMVIVVSHLMSIIKDQVCVLNSQGIAAAYAV